MPEKFKLIEKKYSKVDNEWQWTYTCLLPFTFKKKTISKITITDHYQIEHGDAIDNQLILNIFQHKVNGRQRLKSLPDSYLLWGREVFRFDTSYLDESYRLIFWFKDNSTNHLWIRNCYSMD